MKIIGADSQNLSDYYGQRHYNRIWFYSVAYFFTNWEYTLWVMLAEYFTHE